MSEWDVRCDDCGRFMSPDTPGASGANIYDFKAMEPSREHWRCANCTDRIGPATSNAIPHDGDMRPYQWFNAPKPSGLQSEGAERWLNE